MNNQKGFAAHGLLIVLILGAVGLIVYLLISRDDSGFNGLTEAQKADPSTSDSCYEYMGEDPWNNLARESEGDFGKCIAAYTDLQTEISQHFRNFLTTNGILTFVEDGSVWMAESLERWCPSHPMNDDNINRGALTITLKKNTPQEIVDQIPTSYENYPVCVITGEGSSYFELPQDFKLSP